MPSIFTEGRSIPKPRLGICSRDRLSCITALRQAQATYAYPPNQTVHVSTSQISRLHPFRRYLPPGHQTAELAAQPIHRRPQTMRLRVRQDSGCGRTQRQLYLLALLPRA